MTRRMFCLAALGLLALAAPARAEILVGLTGDNRLATFDTAGLGTFTITGPVALAGGETLRGIDFRPANGSLYGVGSAGNLYTLDPAAGTATLVTALTPAPGSTFTGLSGSSFGVDFNPVPDRLRVISNTGQNLRVNPDNGQTVADGAISLFGQPIVASAYTNPDTDPATGTTLYGITTGGFLLRSTDPNAGTYDLVASATAAIPTLPGAAGFDITGTGAYAVRGDDLYAVNLTTGGYALLGDIDGPNSALEFTGLAAAPRPVPAPPALALAGVACAALLAARRWRAA